MFEPADRTFVYAVARRIVRNDDDAQDVAQDALLLAHRHRDSFRGGSSHRTWLYRIATTAALTSLRRRRAAQRRVDALATHLRCTGGDDAAPDVQLERARLRARLAGELDALDEKYRRVLELRVQEDVGEREIADQLGLSLATVKIRGFRARNMLRQALA